MSVFLTFFVSCSLIKFIDFEIRVQQEVEDDWTDNLFQMSCCVENKKIDAK